MTMRRLAIALAAALALFSPAQAQTVFNPGDTSGAVAVSGGGTTATSTGSGDQGVRAADPQTTGSYYIEGKLAVQTSGDTGFGICDDSAKLSVIGQIAKHCVLVFKSGNIYKLGAITGISLGAVDVTDTIRVAVSIPNQAIWLAKNGGNWNNDALANPATNTNGIAFPIASSATLGIGDSNFTLPIYPGAAVGAIGDQVTANFGGSSFSFSVPAGFTSGWPLNPIKTPSDWFVNMCAAVTFSGTRNLTAARNASGAGCQTNYMRSTGKYHVEFKDITDVGAQTSIGLTDGVTVYANLGTTTDGLAYSGATGNVTLNGSVIATYSTFAQNDIIDMEIDLDNLKLWIQKNGGNWNNSVSANPATNTGGLSISSLLLPTRPAIAISGSLGDAVEGRFGNTGFTNPAPAGFVAGWPVPGASGANFLVIRNPLTHW